MTPHLVAIIPAAGHSRRMGQPKLLMELSGRSVISRVIEAFRGGSISDCLVVVRPGDKALAREAHQAGAEVIVPVSDPLDMRQSVEFALRHCLNSGVARDGWILVPADHPTLSHDVVRELVAAWSADPSRIAVPVCEGRRGHPTIFPWSVVNEIFALPPDVGLNHLLRSEPERVQEVCISDCRILDDLDTPEDWQRLLREVELDSLPPG